MADLTALLQQFTIRYRTALLARASVLGLLSLGALGALAWRLHALHVQPLWSVGIPAALAASLGTVLIWWVRRRWISREGAAAYLDRAFALEQRLVTAAEFSDAQQPPTLYPLLMEDVTRRYSTDHVRVPRLLDRTTGMLAVVLLLLLLWPYMGSAPVPLPRLPGMTTPPKPPPHDVLSTPQSREEASRQNTASKQQQSSAAQSGQSQSASPATGQSSSGSSSTHTGSSHGQSSANAGAQPTQGQQRQGGGQQPASGSNPSSNSAQQQVGQVSTSGRPQSGRGGNAGSQEPQAGSQRTEANGQQKTSGAPQSTSPSSSERQGGQQAANRASASADQTQDRGGQQPTSSQGAESAQRIPQQDQATERSGTAGTESEAKQPGGAQGKETQGAAATRQQQSAHAPRSPTQSGQQTAGGAAQQEAGKSQGAQAGSASQPSVPLEKPGGQQTAGAQQQNREEAGQSSKGSTNAQPQMGQGGSQSLGNQEAVKAEIQQLLKEVSGELKQLQAQLASRTDLPHPEAGTSTDPTLYESSPQSSEAPPTGGASISIHVRTDTAESKTRRPATGTGRPSDQASEALPQTAAEEAKLSDEPLEETPNANQHIPPEYRSVFDRLHRQRTQPDGTTP